MEKTIVKQQHTPGKWEWIQGESLCHRELIVTEDKGQGQDSIAYHGANWPMTEASNARVVIAKATEGQTV